MAKIQNFNEYREKHIAIDPERLDEECFQQPTLYDRAQQAVLDAERSLRAAKKDHNQLRSRLWLEGKNNPASLGFQDTKKAPTKDDIEQGLLQNEHYIRSLNLIDSLTEVVDEAKNYVRSVEMKKTALVESIKLWLGNYYATPKVKETQGGKHFTDFMYERAETKLRERLRESKEKREQAKQKVRDRISPAVHTQFDEVTEKEDAALRDKKKKMLGLDDTERLRRKKLRRPRRKE